LARILDLPDPPNRDRGYIVLVRYASVLVGLKVDRVDQVETVTRAELEGSHEDLSVLSSPYIKSRTVGRVGLLNTEAIFTHPIFHSAVKAATATSHAVSIQSHAQRDVAPSF
jgi:chemotaxis signal transduction protein